MKRKKIFYIESAGGFDGDGYWNCSDTVAKFKVLSGTAFSDELEENEKDEINVYPTLEGEAISTNRNMVFLEREKAHRFLMKAIDEKMQQLIKEQNQLLEAITEEKAAMLALV